MASKIKNIFKEHQLLCKRIDVLEKKIEKCVDVIATSLLKKNKILICGNGGSASDAQHIAAEFINRFKKERNPLGAIALTTDTSIITSISNDYNFDQIFEKQIRAIGRKGDVLIAISTSGKSKNVLRAVKTAKEMDIYTIGLSGKHSMNCDININIPSKNTPRIQEMHMLIYHIICELVEERICKEQFF